MKWEDVELLAQMAGYKLTVGSSTGRHEQVRLYEKATGRLLRAGLASMNRLSAAAIMLIEEENAHPTPQGFGLLARLKPEGGRIKYEP
jgi:hypothetical protein